MIAPKTERITIAQTGAVVGGKVVQIMFTQLQFGNELETQFELTAALVAVMQAPLFENPVEHWDGEVTVKFEVVVAVATPLIH